VLWNPNRGNRNFLTSGTGTVIIYCSGSGTYVFDFLHLKFFQLHFTINLTKLVNFFLVKTLTMKKGKIFPNMFFGKLAFYGLDMEQEPEP
jgi:hypothetical protein